MDGGNNNKTPRRPRPQGSHVSTEELVVDSDASDQEPYVTPFQLEKKIRKVVVPPDDIGEAESSDSEVEQRLRGKASKKAGGVKSTSDKVR